MMLSRSNLRKLAPFRTERNERDGQLKYQPRLTLEAEYRDMYGVGMIPAADDMLTINPLLLSIIPGNTALVINDNDFMFMSAIDATVECSTYKYVYNYK